LGEKAIYYDTVSVTYIQPKDDLNLIETGDRMGDMTSELRPTDYVSEFVSGDPKNYTHKVIDIVTGRADTVCKLRGITLNYSYKRLVNFEVIRDMILGTDGERTVTVKTERMIKRKRKGESTLAIVTEPEDKI